MGTKFQFRRGTATEWILKNPILDAGEPGLVIGTNKLKFGNGVTPWMLLPYFNATSETGGTTSAELEDHVNSPAPHPVYDDAPSLVLLYQNAKV